MQLSDLGTDAHMAALMGKIRRPLLHLYMNQYGIQTP